MAIKTGKISYNLGKRGYQAHGQARNFNIPLIVAAINGEATQERVRSRSMLGFYGHWPRVKFGMFPSEGGVDGKKAVPVEPAIVTTYLHALPDGTIEHEAEFLTDTEPGKSAVRLHNSRVGGFSSVIDEVRGIFIGLDYVMEPNFRDNRGYALDHANGLTFDSASGMTMDDVDAAIRNEQLHAMNMVLDSARTERELADQVIRRQEDEIENLMTVLSKASPATQATFDSVMYSDKGARPIRMDSTDAERMKALAGDFLNAPLSAFKSAQSEPSSAVQQSFYQRILSRY